MIDARDVGTVRILSLRYGKANLLDTELLAALEASLGSAETDPIEAVVLTGTGHVFSAGVDLFRVLDGGADYLDEFLPALSRGIRRLFTFPKPVVAAVNGHAIAGGCILSCACDIRIGTRGNGTIGVPELRVGVPFPAAGLEVVRFAVGNRKTPEVVFGGATYPAEAALALGLLDDITDPQSLLDGAISEAQRLAAVGARTFAFSKAQVRRDTVETILREGARTDAEVLALWKAPNTQARIRAYLDRTLGGG